MTHDKNMVVMVKSMERMPLNVTKIKTKYFESERRLKL